MSNYAVEYKGVKSKEERGQEQIEEQKVIEAKIRMRQQELQDEEEKQHKKEAIFSNKVCETSGGIECEEIIASSRDASTAHRQSQNTRQNRADEFDLDLEDLMVMEAIWLSIQENGLPEQYTTRDHYIPLATEPSPSSPSGGLACAIAALAERQQFSGESSSPSYSGHISSFDMLPSSSRNSHRLKNSSRHPAENYSSRAMSSARMLTGDHGVDHLSDVVEVGTSYITSDDSDGEAVVHPPPPPPPPPPHYGSRYKHKRFKNIRSKYSKISKNLHDTLAKERPPPPAHLPYDTAGASGPHYDEEDGDEYHVPLPPPPPQQHDSNDGFQTSTLSQILPESFEEQMMLAMAVSLAEAQATTAAPRVAWQ